MLNPLNFLSRIIKSGNQKELDRLNKLAKKRGQNLSQMALAWVLNNKAITSALIGARTVTQLRDCLASLDNLKFGKEEIKKINQKAKDGDINIWAPSSSY